MRSLGTLALVGLVLLCTARLRAQPAPVVITKQPASEVKSVVGKAFSLSVEATGTALRYRWYSNNVALPATQTNATMVWTSNVPTATFYVIVSNAVNWVRSSNSIVRTIPDTFGPSIRLAMVPVGEPSRIYVYFDEDILRVNVRNPGASGTNSDNYIVTDTASNERLLPISAVPGTGLQAVRLTFAENPDPRKSYEICLHNISDFRTNYIALNSCVPVSFEYATNIFSFGSFWSFYDWVEAPPANWKETDFFEDPMLWGLAPGMFYYDPAVRINPPCTFRNWALSVGSGAYYFRKHFTVPPEMRGPVTLFVRSVIDDGAAFYLNGTEILRTNLPAGPLTHQTRASSEPSQTVCVTNRVAITNLLSEANVLAVELHEAVSPDFDVAFDGGLSLNYLITPVLTNRPPAGDVFLRYSNHSPTELRLYWTNGMGFALEYVDRLGDQWRELQPPSTNVIVEKSAPTRFYRLNKRH